MFGKRRCLTFEPLEPRSMLSTGGPVETLATVYVHIPDNLTGRPGEEVVAPVNIDNAAGVRGADIRINYDPALLETDTAGVQAGSVWPVGSTEVVANVDQATGSIVAWVFTAEGLNPGNGSLLEVQFAIDSGATVGDTTKVDLAKVRLNEGAIVPDPDPIPGDDPTDGLIAFVGAGDTAALSGVVYADTNNNNQPDPLEGIPRVKIVLVNVDTGAQRETYTEDDGRYEFRDLAAHVYQVREQQPAALLDGGPNEISVDLAAGQIVTGQDFRERGLAPAYVYNRLFTTVALPVGSASWVGAVRHIVTEAGSSGAQAQSFSAEPAAGDSKQPAAGDLNEDPVVSADAPIPASSVPQATAAAEEPAPNPTDGLTASAAAADAAVVSGVVSADATNDDLRQLAAYYVASLSPESKELEPVDAVFEMPDAWLLDC